MKNCLVTKLKDVVDNDSLEVLGVIEMERVYLSDEISTDAFISFSRHFTSSENIVKITILGDGYFMSTYGGTSIGKEITLDTQNETPLNVYTSNGNYKIKIDSKYYFRIDSGSLSRAYRLDLKDTYWTKISSIQGLGFVGKLGDVNTDNITNLNMESTSLISYTSDDIEKLMNLSSINVKGSSRPKITATSLGKLYQITGNCQISPFDGDIVDFVHTQRSIVVDGIHPRETFDGTLNLKWIAAAGKAKFNGNTIDNVENGYITWTTTTITFRGETITA